MATYLNYPFDAELFNYNWANAKDTTLTAMIESGAVQTNAELAKLIANGSDYFTLPFYKTIGGEAENYDGATDITLTAPQGGSQSGVVVGRAHGWKEQDFVVDFNSGADPMKQITSQVAKYWAKNRQNRMLKILDGVFGVTDTEWNKHKIDIASSTSTVASTNKMGATTIGEATQSAVGDNADAFSLAFMHSKVASNLASLNVLEYLKYTDANGIQRPMKLATINGLLVVIDDGCPVDTNGTNPKYTTYLLGSGAFQFASAPVKTPSEVVREALDDGGYTALVTRVREALHPNGFTFTKPSGSYTNSATDAQLATAANWSVSAENAKSIALARIISNG